MAQGLPAWMEDDVQSSASTALPSWMEDDKRHISLPESALHGAEQGATLSFADEMQGLLSTQFGKMPKEGEGYWDAYRRNRDEARAADEAARLANPKTYFASSVLSGLAVPVPGGSAVAGAKGLKALIPLIKGGAALGAAAGLGSSEADLTKGEIGGAIADTALGAGLGAAATGATGGATSFLGSGAKKLASYAGKQVAASEERAAQMAAEKVAEELASARGSLGGETQRGNRLLENLLRLKEHANPEQLRAIEELEQNGTIKELAQSALQSNIGDLPGQAAVMAEKRGVYGSLLAGQEQAEQKLAQETLSPGAAVSQVGARLKRYGAPMVGRAIGGVFGGAVGGPAGMAGGALVGDMVGSLAGGQLRPSLHAVKRMLQHPAVQNSIFSKIKILAQMAPQSLGKYASRLVSAVSRGDQALSVTHYLLSQLEQEYRQMTKQLEGDQESQ